MVTKVTKHVLADASVRGVHIDATDAAALRTAIGAAAAATTAVTDAANTFTADQTISSTDAGAAEGPKLSLYRDSVSPAAADDLGAVVFQGKDGAGNLETYAKIRAVIVDAAAGSEDGKIVFLRLLGGSLGTAMQLGGGLWMNGATGGDPGDGKINAAGLQLNGAALPLTKSFASSNQTITAAGALTLAHSLGEMPKLIQVHLKCLTAEHGYSIGDEVPWHTGDANAGRGCSVVPDATNLNVRFGSNANTFNVINKTTGASAAITNANWAAIFKAWA